MKVKLGEAGQVKLPSKVRQALRLKSGDALEIHVIDGHILMRPVRDPEQAWFWTPEWQAKEREADEDFKAGRFKSFTNVEDLIADLRARRRSRQ
ncbi:MAG: AbrB/MazE/SpoVT family DNA-binding domain-containing protein [Candidatus Bipolaricaulota bacterium]|nr:AbrB/MazE/SpoVT family DNA-binding domain-containing protein [Candidatus Bipolaricaulota bacterium]MDW8141200.1 AbrB/MazE/SpoVT family DNA-binding domain-containing protein [Candidatus Bipolaricaulota bacterium]